MSLPEPLAARFRTDLARHGATGGPVGVAVSGGPDSLALLILAAAALPGEIRAATVDHGIRPESAMEAARVSEISASFGIPHRILKVEVPHGGQGLQGEARRARYAALRDWAETEEVGFLCTAHHADDQAETLLMRLRRGAGLPGLSGIRPRRADGAGLLLVRPLLDWRKAELEEIVRSAGIVAVDDPSNRDERFDRAAVRKFLKERSDFDPVRLARSAAAIREADEALEWFTETLWNQRVSRQDEEWQLDPSDLPRAIRRRLIIRTIASMHATLDLRPAWSGSEDVETMLSVLEEGGTATLAGTMASGGALWRIRPAPPRRRTG